MGRVFSMSETFESIPGFGVQYRVRTRTFRIFGLPVLSTRFVERAGR